jgi:hypothetical protein
MTPHEWMLVILAVAAALILLSFWRAHRNIATQFNALDLIMVDGRVDKIAAAFMLVLGVTTWIMIDLQIKGKMTEGYLTSFGAMWVFPLVAKFVFGKTEMPTGTISSSTIVQQTTEVKQ